MTSNQLLFHPQVNGRGIETWGFDYLGFQVRHLTEGDRFSANTGTLKLINTTINGGTVALTNSSLLQLTNGTIHSSSTLNNSTSGTIEALAGTNTLGGTANNSGLLKIDNGAVLNLENGSYPTLGKVTLNSTGNFTELIVNGAGVTLSGGSVTIT